MQSPIAALNAALDRQVAIYRQADDAVGLITCALIAHKVRAAHPDAVIVPLGVDDDHDTKPLYATGEWIGPDNVVMPLDKDVEDYISAHVGYLDESNEVAWEPLCGWDEDTTALTLRLDDALTAANHLLTITRTA
jgi:hypothetical protein